MRNVAVVAAVTRTRAMKIVAARQDVASFALTIRTTPIIMAHTKPTNLATRIRGIVTICGYRRWKWRAKSLSMLMVTIFRQDVAVITKPMVAKQSLKMQYKLYRPVSRRTREMTRRVG